MKGKAEILFASLVLALALTGCANGQQQEEQEALNFLYAYMPLPDQVDYDESFWLRNVQSSLQARREMPWGKTVPDREWRHFVLPVRVNNERLDSSRWVFYDELKDRVKDLSMSEAILEVNHWCHEHVCYTPSDERTSSPLATLRTAYGRCGEESTFTVAALRAMGIPARQVYTPRWAHTDDNHAWVEAWADGQWHFLGACEPEAVLDLGWFNAPASRGIVMHTKVFGAYDGPEEVMERNECFTEINVTRNYAPVGTAFVKVMDGKGNAVENADVNFCIYNYAEFYDVATRQTDRQGIATMEAGMGDLVAWASDGERFGFATCSAARKDTAIIIMIQRDGVRYSADLDIVPPAERNTLPELTDEQKARNAERLAYEDSLRNAYVATFNVSEPLLAKSRGNYQTLIDFMAWAEDKERAEDLLKVVSDKDLRDIELRTLQDAYLHTPQCPTLPRDFYNRYVLSPRVLNEMVLPHRDVLATCLKGSVDELIQWVKDSIRIDAQHNPQHLRMTPLGVWQHRTTDSRSRDIFFVSACRAQGHPARINPVTGQLQVADADLQWRDVEFDEEEPSVAQYATLRATLEGCTPNPKYYTHFTLSRIKNGKPTLLSYRDEDNYETLLKEGTEVEMGDYMLVSGTRMASGKVLAHVEVFPVASDTETTLVMRSDTEDLSVIGSLNSEALYVDAEEGEKSILSTTGRGYFVIGVIAAGDEPTNHVLRDMAASRRELEAWGRPILLLFRSQADAARFRRQDFEGLPSNVRFGVDERGEIVASMPGATPVVKIADTFNRVVFSSEGYTIGMGEKLVGALRKL